MTQQKTCIVCKTKLTGKQRYFCSLTCQSAGRNVPRTVDSKVGPTDSKKQTCSDCGKSKSPSDFTFRRTLANEAKVYSDRCLACHRERIAKAKSKANATPPVKADPVKRTVKNNVTITKRTGKFERLVGGM